MATGTIKKITEKGFGFINDGQQDIFFISHHWMVSHSINWLKAKL